MDGDGKIVGKEQVWFQFQIKELATLAALSVPRRTPLYACVTSAFPPCLFDLESESDGHSDP